MGQRYTVRAGDCLLSIGRQLGVPWQRIWDAPENASLRERRHSPTVLQPGDVVVVPERQAKTVSIATGAWHRFVVQVPRATVRLRLLADGQPRAGKAYVMELEDRSTREGTTDADGFVVQDVPAATSRVTVRLELSDFGTEEYMLRLGQLDPAEAPRGVQQRLSNLGFDCARSGELDASTQRALALFQEREGLEASGTLDARTSSGSFSSQSSTSSWSRPGP